MQCALCAREQETKTDRLPPGWKRHQDRIWCRDCWGQSFILRAHTVPVAGPVDAEWADLRAALKQAWEDSTSISNWAVLELARNDTPRLPCHEKLGPMPKLYLYPGARQAAPSCSPQSVTAILHAVEGKYRKSRLAVLWHRSQSLPFYRYPVPYPVHNQGWSCTRTEKGEPCVTFRMGDRRWLLRLRAGKEFRRQLAAWKQIIDGEAVQGELALIGQWTNAGDHRNGTEARNPGGGARRQLRIMAKMVGWFPRKPSRGLNGTLYARTSHPHFLAYHVGADGEPKHLHATHVRRWEAQHRRRLETISDDTKYEKRWPRATRQNMLAAQDVWVKHYRDRLAAFTHESSAMLAAFAARAGVAAVELDTTDRAFCERFPWHEFIEKLRYKLETYGIDLRVTSPKDAPPEGE